MKVSHRPAELFAAFDDPDLIAHAGLVPTIRLAERCGLPALVAQKVRLTGAKNGAGTAADAKAMSIVGGMIAGADSIDDLDILRHGGLPRLFGDLHFQIVTVKTSTCAPMIVATRLRKGSAGSGKGAASLLREALATVRAMGITAHIVVRADSAHFSHKVVHVCRKAGAAFSLAVAVKKTIREAIAQIPEDAWTPIKYASAAWDAEEERWISDAEITEIEFTAFTSKKKAFHTTARLIVRRVKRLNPKSVPAGQAELFGVWRWADDFTDLWRATGQRMLT